MSGELVEPLRSYFRERLTANGLRGMDASWGKHAGDFYVHRDLPEGRAGHCNLECVGARYMVTHVPGQVTPLEPGETHHARWKEVARFGTFEEAALCCRQVLDAELAAVALSGGVGRHILNPGDPCDDCGGNGYDGGIPRMGQATCGRCGGLGVNP